MAKSKQPDQDIDIVEEQYKGPGALAAGAGEGFVSHFKWAFAGLGAGVIGGAIFHKPVNGSIQSLQKLAEKHADHINFLIRWPAKALRFVVGHGKDTEVNLLLERAHLIRGGWEKSADPVAEKAYVLVRKHALHKEKGLFYTLADELLNDLIIPRDIKKKFMSGRIGDHVNAAATAGGMLASMGYFLVPIFSFGTGSEKAHQGRQQFERARDEIIRLRNQASSQEGKPGTEEAQTELPADNRSSEKLAPPANEAAPSPAAVSAPQADGRVSEAVKDIKAQPALA